MVGSLKLMCSLDNLREMFPSKVCKDALKTKLSNPLHVNKRNFGKVGEWRNVRFQDQTDTKIVSNYGNRFFAVMKS